MSDYDVRARETAHRNLKPKSQGGKGQAVTLLPAGHGAYDPASGSAPPTAAGGQACCGIELAYSAREIDGTKILASDRKFMMSALSVHGVPITAPAAGQHVRYADGKARKVENVEAFHPAGLAIYYYVQLRA